MTSSGTRDWWAAGEQAVADIVQSLDATDLEQPSLLPGWPRRMVVAHLARNADALGNLLTWAKTGIETPMYASTSAREYDIRKTAKLPGPELTADMDAAAGRLAEAVASLTPNDWITTVRTAQGRTVPADEVIWMRCREVWVHATDLDAGVGLDAPPPEYLAALIDDVVRTWERRDASAPVSLIAVDSDRSWRVDATEEIVAPLAELAELVTGRRHRADVAFPAWL